MNARSRFYVDKTFNYNPNTYLQLLNTICKITIKYYEEMLNVKIFLSVSLKNKH